MAQKWSLLKFRPKPWSKLNRKPAANRSHIIDRGRIAVWQYQKGIDPLSSPEMIPETILNQFNLKDKSALVTGSSRGLGAAIAVALAEAGANVAVHGSSSAPAATQQKLEALGVKSAALVGDVGDATVCARLVEETVQQFGSIDILVNNAGIIRRSPAAEHPEEDWKEIIDVNLSSVFR